jgi:hypothetical protein
MPRIWAKLGAFGLAAIGFASFVPACAHNDESVVIKNVIPPGKPQAGQVCTFDGTGTDILFAGSLDVSVARSYFAALKIENRLQPRTSVDKVRAESNSILLTGATVKLTRPTGETIDEFTNLASTLIDPGTSPQPGSMVAVVISPKAAQTLHDELKRRDQTSIVIANVKVFGRTLGGVDVESNEYPFPITVCRGCLLDFSCQAAGSKDNICTGAIPQDKTQTCGPSCFAGQDAPTIPCQACTNPQEPACDKTRTDWP